MTNVKETLPQKDDNEKPNSSAAKNLIDLVLKLKPVFLHDNLDVPFASIAVDNHQELYPIRSKRFKTWIIKQYWNRLKKPPATESVKQAIDVLSSMALFEGQTVEFSNRVAIHENAIWYDLCDEDWQAVKITDNAWKIVQPPIIFRRYKHQDAQCMPVKGGNVSDIMKYVNIADERQRLLLQVYLVSALIPNIPHPIPILYGSQGSAKSTFLRVLRRLIDPSALELLTFPTRKDQLVQQLSHHWAPYYDNVTTMPDWLSDSLCRAVTGEGFSKRELYTDDEDVIYSFKCCIGINGINIVAQRADLLDRSILFSLERIRSEKRKDEKTFWEEFEKDRPLILGAAFTALSKAMVIKREMRLEKLPRMADFALWGCAIAEALGYRKEEFMVAYNLNIQNQNEEAIQENPVATTIRTFMSDQDEWFGTSTELLEILTRIARRAMIDIKQPLWPKGAQSMTRRMNETKTNLANVGIIIHLNHGKQRLITIRNGRNDVDSVENRGSNDNVDAIPATF